MELCFLILGETAEEIAVLHALDVNTPLVVVVILDYEMRGCNFLKVCSFLARCLPEK